MVPADNPAVVEWRLNQAEKKLDGKADQEDLNQIASEVRSLRKVLVGLMVTIATSAVLFSFTVLQLLAAKP